MIESIIESPAPEYDALTGTITSVIGDETITGVGTSFDTELAASDIVAFLDDTGNLQYHVVDSVTDATHFEARQKARAVGTAKAIYQLIPFPSYFQPDTDYPNVPVFRPFSAGANNILANVLSSHGSLSKISQDEGVLIKSVYARMPYQFTWADSFLSIGVFSRALSDATIGTRIFELGEGDGVLNIPIENIEVPVDIYIPPNAAAVAAGEKWQILSRVASSITTNSGTRVNPAAQHNYTMISSVGTPTILEHTFQPIIIGMRIRHADTALTA